MKIIKGTSALSGIAIGTGCFYGDKKEESIPHYSISPQDSEKEISRLSGAYENTLKKMKELNEASLKMFGKQAGEIFDVHTMILADMTIRSRAESLIRDNLMNAEHAVYDAFGEYAKMFNKDRSHFDEISHDIMDVRDRLLASFLGEEKNFMCSVGEEKPVIVVAMRLTPEMVLSIPKNRALAFVTDEGGFTTHATILARNFGVPIVFNVDIDDNIECGDTMIVDGHSGKVVISPDETTIKSYKKKLRQAEKRRAVCLAKKNEPPVTGRGLRIKLKCNISVPNELELMDTVNYDGVGLLRSEFLFSSRSVSPTAEEWSAMYVEALARADGKSVVVRLVDIGGDKLPGYLNMPDQENPDLGIRGARAIDIFGDVYFEQIKGILTASKHGDIRILYPMISDVSDIESFRTILKKAKKSLKDEGVKFNNRIKQGVMIEVPSAALMAESIMQEVDFVNIGSNDLVQYTLAAARGNRLIENRYHILHPSMARLMDIVVKAGRKHRKEVCLCGEIADFEEFYPILLAMGLRDFSVAASRLDDLKCFLLHQKVRPRSILKEFYGLKTKKDIDRFFQRLNKDRKM